MYRKKHQTMIQRQFEITKMPINRFPVFEPVFKRGNPLLFLEKSFDLMGGPADCQEWRLVTRPRVL